MRCLVRSQPPISASQAVFTWTTVAGRNNSVTAGHRDGQFFADIRPAVRLVKFSVISFVDGGATSKQGFCVAPYTLRIDSA